MESMYTILGLEDFAPISEIRKAYLAKILTIHPDITHSDDNSAELLAKLKESYDKLKDPASKEQYDKFLKGNFFYRKPFRI